MFKLFRLRLSDPTLYESLTYNMRLNASVSSCGIFAVNVLFDTSKCSLGIIASVLHTHTGHRKWAPRDVFVRRGTYRVGVCRGWGASVCYHYIPTSILRIAFIHFDTKSGTAPVPPASTWKPTPLLYIPHLNQEHQLGRFGITREIQKPTEK